MDRITKSLLEDFQKSQALTGMDEDDAFERFANYCILMREYADTFNVEDISTGKGGDTSLDGIACIVNGQLVTSVDEVNDTALSNQYIEATFVFVQAKTSSSFSASEVGSFCFGVKDFFGTAPKLRRNAFIQNAAAIQNAIFSNAALMTRGKPVCKMFYVTTGKWQNDQDIGARAEAGRHDLEELGLFSSVEFTPIDADRLQKLYQSSKSHVTAEFNFTERTVLPEIEGVQEAYLGTLPASEYLRLIEDDSQHVRKSLFYDNVRDFQGENEVNKEIAGTLDTTEGRNRFVVLNNGVTIIAKKLRTVGNRFFVEDYQIVNGCQTSHVLHNNRARLANVIVPVKVIGTTDESVINAIIQGTNRQTQVRAEQLLALQEFPKRLEAYFATFADKRQLHYERRSMQYSTSAGVEKVRVVTMQQQIRAFSSMFLDEPHRATRSYAELLKKVGKEIFGSGHRLEPYYTSAYAQYRLEYFFRNETIGVQYKATRYQMLMLLRHQVGGEEMPSITANKMEAYCAVILDCLWDDAKAAKAFQSATVLIDRVCQGNFDPDNIRTQPFTEALLGALTK